MAPAMLSAWSTCQECRDRRYPPRTRSVGAHLKPWGLAPFLPMPAAELRDRPVTVEQVWGRPAVAELRDRLARTYRFASKSGGGSCANIPATRWTAGRCRRIDLLQERQLTTR
jgi:hypothetical protein